MNYIANLQRILFIFKEFDDTLKNYIEGKLSFIELINIELPLVLPEDDLKEYYTNPNLTFKYLYNWKPKSDKYLLYKDELDKNSSFIKFKNNHSELSHLEINNIFNQMFEYKKWESVLLNLSEIKIDYGKNPIMEFLKYLKKTKSITIAQNLLCCYN